ncbi:MAG: Ig-like domain-containing protein [Sporichthyaceae bacterium]
MSRRTTRRTQAWIAAAAMLLTATASVSATESDSRAAARPTGAALAVQPVTACAANTLASADEVSVGPVALPFPIDFFGVKNNVYVNNNGSVSFGGSLLNFNATTLTAAGRPIIAPFYADVDTSSAGSAQVQYGASVDNKTFCVSWPGVGYSAGKSDKLNRFQLLFVDRSAETMQAGDFDVVFNYDGVDWESGDFESPTDTGLGGFTARAGYSHGAPGNTLQLTGSAVPGALLDANAGTGLIHNKRNSTVDGRYIFPFRGGSLSANELPTVPTPQALATPEDTAGLKNVLAGANDNDGDPVTLVADTNGANGTVNCTAAGLCTYTPALNFTGVDSFTFTATDGQGGFVDGVVNVSVGGGINGAPVVVTPQSLGTIEDTEGEKDVLAGFFDPEGDPLTIIARTNGANGTVTCSPAGVCKYKPFPNFNGTDRFNFTASDSQGNLIVGRVNVTVSPVNDKPYIPSPQAMGTSMGVPATINVRTGVVDVDHDEADLAITVVDGGPNGTVACSQNGKCTYTPNAGFSGMTSFKYRVSDPLGAQTIGTVNVTVTANLPPVVVTPQTLNTTEDTPASRNVLPGATDPNGDTLVVVASTNGVNGTVNCTTGGLCTYTPKPNFNGGDSFTFTVSDGHGGEDVGTVNVTVAAVNDLPKIVTPQLLVTAEDVVGNRDVLAGSSDPDGDTLQVVDHSPSAHGAVACTPGGLCTYTPAFNFSGDDSFTFTVSDGQGGQVVGTVNVTVVGINEAPPSIDTVQELVTLEDTPKTKNVFEGGHDFDGDPITVIAWTQGADGTVSCTPAGVCTYTPDLNENGPDSFTFTVSDGKGGLTVGTVNVTVTPVNDPPIIVTPQVYGTTEEVQLNIPNVLLGASDPEGGVVTVVGTSNPENGTATCTPAGACTYKPDINFTGPDSFTFTASDGQGGTSVGTVNIIVTGVNDLPFVVTPQNYTTPEDTPLVKAVLTGASDPDDDPLTVIANSDGLHGSVQCTLAGSCTYTPDANYNGPDSFIFTVSDGHGGLVIGTVDITVTPVNDPPTIVNPQFLDLNPNSTTNSKNVLIGAVDPDGDELFVSAFTQGANGEVECAAGICTYTPDVNYAGSDSFTFTVSDGRGGNVVGTVVVTVVLGYLCSGASMASPPAGYSPVRGTGEADSLDGGPGNDIMWGGGGNDRVSGHGGDDILCGGAGDDRLEGGAGADIIFGGLGVDRMDGGRGEDELCLDAVDPEPFTGPGTDTFICT